MTNEEMYRIAEETAMHNVQKFHGFFFGLNPEILPEDNYEGAPAGSFIICAYSSTYGMLQNMQVVCDLVGFNFYRIKEVWIKVRAGEYSPSPYLTSWMKETSSGGLIYARQDNSDVSDVEPFFEDRLDKIDDDHFKDDIVNLIDLLARSDEQ